MQEGQAIVLIALLILVLFGMLGLAVDSGRAYVDRRDQQTAVDAAALAAGDWYENFPDYNDLLGTVIPRSVTLYENDLRIYAVPTGSSHTTGVTGVPPNNNLQWDEWDYAWYNGVYTLKIVATNTQFNGYQFRYDTSHNLPLAFIQIFGGNPQVTVGATATSIVGNQRQTPALLTLSNGPGCATQMKGAAATLTILGDAYSNGPVCLDLNLRLAGNCYAASGNCNAAAFWCYNSSPGFTPYDPAINGGQCFPGDTLGNPVVPAPTLPDPGYLASSAQYYNGAGASFNRGSWTEMTPGNWNNFSISGGGCFFLDAGVYTWNGGYTSHGGLLSNELKPPGEVLYNEPGYQNPPAAPSTEFWAGQGCNGTWNLSTAPAPGFPIKHQGGGNWGIELTSVRYDRFTDPVYQNNPCFASPGCVRESAPSSCQQISTVDANNLGIDVNVTQNAPGAQYYNVYINPYGCVGTYAGGTRNDFSFVDTFLAPGWTDGGAPPALATGLPAWNGTLALGRLGYPCGLPTVTICSIDYNTVNNATSACNFYNARATHCRAPWDESPPQCFATCPAPSTVPQDNAAMALQYGPYNGGDLANENLCMQTPIWPGGDSNQPCATARVTPGGVQFYFPAGNNCLDQNGNGSTHVFGGEQYNWIVIYQVPSPPPASSCAVQKLNGNALTQYIGTIYSPTSGWDILGSDTSPLAGQVICWTALVTGSANAGIDFNPNYSPAPPAARLIN